VPVVVFESRSSPTVEVAAPPGARLVDICDASDSPVPFSCRSASCGTCRVVIVEGGDSLEPPGEEEIALLELMGDDPAVLRLACQARLRAQGDAGSPGLLRIRTPDDW
jgi:2Fe-2S ferredoxin